MAGKFSSNGNVFQNNTTNHQRKRLTARRTEQRLLISIACVSLAIVAVLLLILFMNRKSIYHSQGETVHTSLFDFQVDQVQVVDSYPGIASQPGYKLVRMRLKVTNTSNEGYVMFSTDFQIQWNDEDFGTCLAPIDDQMVPFFYKLEPGASSEGLMLIQVPENVKNLTVVYQERLQSGAAGEAYFVRFSL